jgi:hypothetical protein
MATTGVVSLAPETGLALFRRGMSAQSGGDDLITRADLDPDTDRASR